MPLYPRQLWVILQFSTKFSAKYSNSLSLTKYSQFVSQRCKLTVWLLNMIASTLIVDCQRYLVLPLCISTICESFFSFLQNIFAKYSNSLPQTKYSQFVGTKLRTSFHFPTALHDNTPIDNFERYHEIIKCKSWHWKLQ